MGGPHLSTDTASLDFLFDPLPLARALETSATPHHWHAPGRAPFGWRVARGAPPAAPPGADAATAAAAGATRPPPRNRPPGGGAPTLNGEGWGVPLKEGGGDMKYERNPPMLGVGMSWGSIGVVGAVLAQSWGVA